jgi:uncharacterized protein (DUF2141 family)
MKNVLMTATALLTLLSASAQAQNAPAAPASQAAAGGDATACTPLQFTGLKRGEGSLMIAVYGSAETYLKKPVWAKAVKVDQDAMTVPMCDVKSAEVAITAFQDLNNNGKLDSNPMGIPSEPYGASGKPAMFSAPTWADTKVPLAGSAAPIIVKF